MHSACALAVSVAPFDRAGQSVSSHAPRTNALAEAAGSPSLSFHAHAGAAGPVRLQACRTLQPAEAERLRS